MNEIELRFKVLVKGLKLECFKLPRNLLCGTLLGTRM